MGAFAAAPARRFSRILAIVLMYKYGAIYPLRWAARCCLASFTLRLPGLKLEKTGPQAVTNVQRAAHERPEEACCDPERAILAEDELMLDPGRPLDKRSGHSKLLLHK